MSTTEATGRVDFKESRIRSLVKAVVYRILSIIGTGILTWFVTEDMGETAVITLVIQLLLIVLYYSSERIWDKISWGRRIEHI